MSDNVVSLNGGLTGERKPSRACVEQLRYLLQAAESGQVIGIAVAALNCDGVAEYRVAGKVGGFSMIGAMDCAKVELLKINMGED